MTPPTFEPPAFKLPGSLGNHDNMRELSVFTGCPNNVLGLTGLPGPRGDKACRLIIYLQLMFTLHVLMTHLVMQT